MKFSILIIIGILLTNSSALSAEKQLAKSMVSHPEKKVPVQLQNACVETAVEYIKALNTCQPVACVDRNLYGVVASQPKGTAAPGFLHPEKYQWAWVAGYNNLEKYAAWQTEQCNDDTVTKKILTYVGFGTDYISPEYDYYLSVMDLQNEKTILVPSFETWFHVFEKYFDLKIPLPVQKSIILSVSKVAGPSDPTTNFSNLTGCDINAAKNCTDSRGLPGEGCGSAYQRIAQVLVQMSPPMGSGTTKECVGEFIRYKGISQPQAAEVRALLNYCADANPCNTGLGLGFNPAYVPDVNTGSLLEHYTGREYIMQNKSLTDIQAQTIKLPGIK